jgi:hypothetical protein
MANPNEPGWGANPDQDPGFGANPNPQDAQTQDKKNSINQWYNQYGGRAATDAETNQWLGASNFGNVENSIKGAFANQPQQSQTQTVPFDRNKFRDEIVGNPNASAVLAKYGLQASPNGTVTLPTGEIMDVVQGARAGGNLGQWIGVGEVHNGTSTYYGANSGGPTGAYPPTNMPPGPPQNQHDPKWDALYDQLMKRSTQSLNVGANDPIIRGQTDAYAAQQERARRSFLGEQAEAAGPYSTGANLGQARMSAETMGQNTAGFQATLMGKELDSRRQEISQALSQMGGMLTEDQRNALQRELGYLNDATQRYNINTSNETQRYGIDSNAQTAANRLGLDYGNSQADYWLRSQGL